MEEHQKLFIYSLVVTVVLVSSLSVIGYNNITLLQQELVQQQTESNQKISELNELLESDMTLLQNLISNLDKETKKTNKDLLDLITTVQTESQESIQKAKEELEKEITSIETLSTDFSKIVDESLESVVSVLTDKGQGSGAIFTRDGRVVTNFHVIDGASTVNILTYDKTIHRAIILGIDAKADIAVLKIDTNETQFNRLFFGDSDDVRVGESVIALGNPLGLDFTVTQGIVSARRTASNGFSYIQIDTPINPGNSGGPILNTAGEIIGIANFKVTGGEGIGFALPSNVAEESTDNI